MRHSLEFWDTNDSLNSDQKTIPGANYQVKKRNYNLEDFAVKADHSAKIKESEKRD